MLAPEVVVVGLRSDCDARGFGMGAGCGVGLCGLAVVVCGRLEP